MVNKKMMSECACMVKAKYLIALSKAVLGVDLLVYALSKHKQNSIYSSSHSCLFVKNIL